MHLNRWQQHQIYLSNTCNYQCLGCTLPTPQQNIKHKIEAAKPKDIVNIYGGNPLEHPQCMDWVRFAFHKKLRVRLWTNHTVTNVPKKERAMIHELVLWCPSPIKETFNTITGSDNFNAFWAAMRALDQPATLAFRVRPISFEFLPEFTDLVRSHNQSGMLLYYPKEFTAEENAYIKRFKRVQGMRVVPCKNSETPHCLSVPNTIGSAQFEYHDWCYAMRRTITNVPILKYLLA
jgi:hypothetical protein